LLQFLDFGDGYLAAMMMMMMMFLLLMMIACLVPS